MPALLPVVGRHGNSDELHVGSHDKEQQKRAER